jgi:hypothetical protein
MDRKSANLMSVSCITVSTTEGLSTIQRSSLSLPIDRRYWRLRSRAEEEVFGASSRIKTNDPSIKVHVQNVVSSEAKEPASDHAVASAAELVYSLAYLKRSSSIFPNLHRGILSFPSIK